jgi:hypothetical protein
VLFAAYGLAEFTLAVTNYGRSFVRINTDSLKNHLIEFDDSVSCSSIQSCGKALGDTQIRIVKETDT